jgi:hypothetical protein
MTDTIICAAYCLFIWLALAPYYRNGHIILGGEGNVILDHGNLVRTAIWTWLPRFGKGIVNYVPVGVGLNHLALWALQKVTRSVRLVNFLPIFLLYILPFVSFYGLSRILGAGPAVATVASLFYCVNPWTMNYMTLLLGSQVSLTLLPLFAIILLMFSGNPLALFFWFGLTSVVFSFAYGNPPTTAVLGLAVVIMSVVIGGCQALGIVSASFFLFNAMWILPFLATFKHTTKIYPQRSADKMLQETATDMGKGVLWDLLTFKSGICKDKNNNNVSLWWSIIGWMLVSPFMVGVLYFRWWWLVIIPLVFLAKGTAPPLGCVYRWCFVHVPLFRIFKSPTEKFGLLFVFAFALGLLLVPPDRVHGLFWMMPSLMLPALLGHILPDVKVKDVWQTRKYKDPNGYAKLREYLNNDKGDYTVLVFPGVQNYQVCIPMENGRHYTGMDPILFNINKSFITPYGLLNFYGNVMKGAYRQVLDVFNIGKIIINEDLVEWFGRFEKETIADLHRLFSKFPSRKFGNVTVYENKDAMPKIYTSRYPCFAKCINPTLYRVVVQDVKEPFELILSEHFNDGWQAISGQAQIINHQKTQIFANGWEIVPEANNVIITIYYKPQELFYCGLGITTLTMLWIIWGYAKCLF